MKIWRKRKKIILNIDEEKLLEKLNIKIFQEINYAEYEIESILDEIYLNESTNVDINDKLANKYADLADKIESQIRKNKNESSGIYS